MWVSLELLASSRATAQQAKAQLDPFAGVEEMIVTGAGGVDLLTPSDTAAITFDADALKNIGIEDIGDLAAYVPNLEITTVNATNASFFVRGVGLQDFGANASSSVPIFQDGIPRNASATQLVGLFDIAAISVLKGPQGSGNFRNASAGSFIVKTIAPEPDFSGTAKITLARINSVDARDANRYSFQAASNAAIYEDVVSARISARYTHENPFWENRCANRIPIEDRPVQGQGGRSVAICGERIRAFSKSTVTPFLHRYIGEIDDYGIRGQIRVKPTDVPLDWTTRVEISNLNRDSTTGQFLGTGGLILGQGDRLNYRDPDQARRENYLFQKIRTNRPSIPVGTARQMARETLAKELQKKPLDRRPYTGDLDHPGRTLLETHTISTTGVYVSDVAETTANLGFIDYRKSEGRDQDLSPNEKFSSQGRDQAFEVYGDVGVKGDAIGAIPIAWDTGVYSMYEKVDSKSTQNLGVFDALGNGTRQRNDFQQEITSFGLYANASYELTEAFTLSAGLRYNYEQKDFEVFNNSQQRFGDVISDSVLQSANQRTWDAPTGFANLAYAFTEDVSTYLKYSRGFKAGHFNPSKADDAKVPGTGFADPESIDAVEWGFTASAWSNRIRSTGAFFYYNYHNYQVFRLTTNFNGVFRVVQNAKRARNYGAELEIVMNPLEGLVPEAIEGLSVTLRGGWLEAQFVQFTVSEQRQFIQGSFGVSIDYSGNPLLNAPNLQASAIFAWPLVSNEYGTVTPQYDFTWTDDVPFDPNKGKGEPVPGVGNIFPSYTVGQRAYILHNVRLSWSPPGESGIQVAGWCRNLTDRRYKTFGVDISTFSAQQLIYVGDPRTCGADISFTW